MILYVDFDFETMVTWTVLMSRAHFITGIPIFTHLPLAGYDPSQMALIAAFMLTDGRTVKIYNILRSYER